MDLATLLGMLGAFAIVLAAIFVGGSALTFLNVPSILIVLGGTFFVVLMKFSLKQFIGAFKVATRAFLTKQEDPEELIERIVSLSEIARKGGMLALESEEIDNQFLNDGIILLSDGHTAETINTMMTNDLSQTVE